jgi:TolB protein
MPRLSLSYRDRHLTLVAAALCTLFTATACERGADAATRPPVAAPVSTPAPTTRTPSTAPSTEAARSLAGIPGALFYTDDNGHLSRLTTNGTLIRVASDADLAEVSPDGTRVARITESGDVLVTDREGGPTRKIYSHAASLGMGPTWSADGRSLLIARNPTEFDRRPGVLTVATKRFTALPALNEYLHPRWSGDGRSIAMVTGCRLATAAADGSKIRVVPVVGDGNRKNNPTGSYACDVLSVNRDGTRLAIDLKAGDEPAGDIAGDYSADTVIDTATGAAVALPVRGEVRAVLFRPDGSMIVRSRSGKVTTLTVLSADGRQLAKVAEPASVNKLGLTDYTR